MPQPWAHPLFRAVSGGEWHPGGAGATDRLWRACRAALAERAEERRDGRPLRLLDAGCGAGAAAWRLAAEGLRVVALDKTPQPGWREASFPGSGTAGPFFCAADVCRMPLRDGWADVALCQCVVSLLARPEGFFDEAARVLRPGGVLGFSDLMRRGEDAGSTGGCVAGARRREEWEQLLRDAGFRLLSFADESRELARLAAQLVWHGDGESLRQLGLCCASGPAASGGRSGGRPGYGVWVAENAGRTI